MAKPIGDDEKKKIIKGILSTFAKTGAFITTINNEMKELTGLPIAATRAESEEFLRQMTDVRCDVNGMYFSESTNSQHINKLVEGQRDKFAPNWNAPNRRFRFDAFAIKTFSSINRPLPRYDQSYIDVNIASTSSSAEVPRAGRIRQRRPTMGATTLQRSAVGRRNRSFSPEQRRRSASRSPQWHRNRRDRSVSRSRSRSRKRSVSPRRRYDARGRDRSRSRSRRRSVTPYRGRSRTRDRSRSKNRRSRSPARRERTRSPSRSVSRQKSPPYRSKRSRTRDRSRSLDKRPRNRSTVHNPSNSQNRRSPSKDRNDSKARKSRSPAKRSKSPESSRNRGPISPKTKPLPPQNRAAEKPTRKGHKFVFIGDGFLHELMMQVESGNEDSSQLCVSEQTIEEAIKKVHLLKSLKHDTKKRKKVIISIGAADIANGTSLVKMKENFAKLFIFCQRSLNMKPIVVTLFNFHNVHSTQTVEKINIFNKFLKENFTNVVNVWDVISQGFGVKFANRKNSDDDNKPNLLISKMNRLILKQ